MADDQQAQGQQGGANPPAPPMGGVPVPPPPAQQAATGGGQVGASQGQQPPAQQEFLRPRPPDSELGIGSVGDFKTNLKIPAHANTTFDEAYFLKMLAGSISLTKNEKAKIVGAIPKLSQYQVDELIKILEEERRKFAELDEKHQVQIKKLQEKQEEDWNDLEMGVSQEDKKEEDTAAADALTAQIMSGGALAKDDSQPVADQKCEKCQGDLNEEGKCPKCDTETAEVPVEGDTPSAPPQSV